MAQNSTSEECDHTARKLKSKRVSKNGMTPQDAAAELKVDREIVMETVSENGHALQHATEELKGDPEIVMRVVSKNGLTCDMEQRN